MNDQIVVIPDSGETLTFGWYVSWSLETRVHSFETAADIGDVRNLPQADGAGAQLLAQARSWVDPVYRAVIEAFPARLRRVADYHIGWDATGKTSYRPGKAIRPALVLASAGVVTGGKLAAGGHRSGGRGAGARFTLLHDDVMDGDRLRRGRLSVWARFGTPAAVLVGDMMLAAATDLLAQQHSVAAAVLTRVMRTLCEGQCADIEFEDAPEVSLAMCIRMAENKTDALFGGACQLGTVVSGASTQQAAWLHDFETKLGLAYQLSDDLAGIWGTSDATGKPAYSDLARRKKSLPVVAALAADGTAAHELRSRYSSGAELSQEEFADIAELIERAGGRRWAENRLAEICNAAEELLKSRCAYPEHTRDLRSLVELVGRRNYVAGDRRVG